MARSILMTSSSSTFSELKRIMRRLCGEIDHLVLLPLESARIRVVEDCGLLPVPNTTVAMLGNCSPRVCTPSSTPPVHVD
jgi:hypothetical protein